MLVFHNVTLKETSKEQEKVESAADVGNDHRDPSIRQGKLYRLNRRRYRQHADVCLVCDAGVGHLFYAIYLLCTRPHDSRLVQIYLMFVAP